MAAILQTTISIAFCSKKNLHLIDISLSTSSARFFFYSGAPIEKVSVYVLLGNGKMPYK